MALVAREISYIAIVSVKHCLREFDIQSDLYEDIPYSGKVWQGGKFGEFGESSMIRQTSTIQLSTNNL